ncbi:MAG: MFS transporter [Proteobacteria bacterium]|nr:MFS transporter [Pseudomonadota bacterium]
MDDQKKKYRWIVFSACLAAFITMLDSYIVNIALPTISNDYHVGTGTVSGVSLYYLLFLTATLPLFGKLADRMGLKRIFLIGYAIFTIASLLCGYSLNIEMLFISRGLQGIGGAMLTICVYALIPAFIPEHLRGWAFGLMASSAALGITLGAPLGGIITGFVSWPWIFRINLPIGIAAIWIAIKMLPENRPSHAKPGGSLDLTGVILSFLIISGFLFALNKGSEFGWMSPAIIGSFIGASILLILFLRHEARQKEPLIDFRLYRIKSFLYSNLSAMMAFMFMAGSSFLLPFYLQTARGLTPQAAGLMILFYSLVYMSMGPVSGRLSDKMSARTLCMIAMAAGSGAAFFFSFLLGRDSFVPVVIYLSTLGVTFGLFISPNNRSLMGDIPQEHHGVASALYSTFSRLSITFGVCIFETIFSLFLPETGSGPLSSTASISQLMTGFRVCFFIGGWVFMAGLFFSSRYPVIAKPANAGKDGEHI